VDDGTFWMDFTRFLMGFAHVDVCFAFRGWRCRSLPNAFPADKKSGQRLCAVHTVRCAGGVPATLMVMALQPTKRGAWCRADRKKSYKLGDLSLLIARLNEAGDAVEAIVGGGFRGADRGERAACVRMEPGRTYALLPLCMSAAPTAAEQTRAAPFTLRLGASERVLVSAAAPTARAALGALALQAVHAALLGGGPPRPPAGLGRAAELERLLLRAENAPLLVGGDAAPRRRVARLSRSCAALVATADGGAITLVVVYNLGDELARVRCTAYVKSTAARGADGPLANQRDDADSYYRRRSEAEAAAAAARPGPAAPSRERGFRWPAKWACYRAVAAVPPRTRRLVLVLAASGMQAELGEVDCEIVDAAAAAAAAASGSGGGSSSEARRAEAASAGVMASWLGGAPAADGKAAAPVAASWAAGASADGIFAAAPLGAALLSPGDDAAAALNEMLRTGIYEDGIGGDGAGGSSSGGGGGGEDDDAALRAALEQSAREAGARPGGPSDDAALSAAIAASLADGAGNAAPAAAADDDDDALRAALAASAASAKAHAEQLARREAAAVAAAIAASLGGGAGTAAEPVVLDDDSDATDVDEGPAAPPQQWNAWQEEEWGEE